MVEDIEIIHSRLSAQNLTKSGKMKPEDVVSAMAAIQAQDYSAALWAIGKRAGDGIILEDVLRSIEEARIVRTWLNRGTIHFSHSDDMRGLLNLFKPGLLKIGMSRDQHLGLDNAMVQKTEELFRDALSEKDFLTRAQMYEIMDKLGLVGSKNNMGYHMLYRAAWDGLICFGPQMGGEQTFTLMEKWLPDSEILDEDEAISRLAVKYFSSHGPATIRDFAWWSGLKISQCRAAVERNASKLERIGSDTVDYYRLKGSSGDAQFQDVLLLPAFDEYLVGYTDRELMLNGIQKDRIIMKNGTFRPVILNEGKVAGTWKSRENGERVTIVPDVFVKLDKIERASLKEASTGLGEFLGKDIEIGL